MPSRCFSSLCRAGGDLGQLVAQSRTGAPQVVAPRHRSNDFRFGLVCRRGFPRRVCYAGKNPKFARNYPQYSNEELPVKRCSQMPSLPLQSLGFPPSNLWTCEIRGGIFVEDNDDVLERREVSLR
ncbi:hypothetical protein A2U01_0034116 [Trifolium medium]|uniref:Uncharacterized protein n=1 Tax=Trifolium medium TaxID=97028 RepID=A0A392PMG3_9FABA|nr:hypothetical protein [Trifolium medium]